MLQVSSFPSLTLKPNSTKIHTICSIVKFCDLNAVLFALDKFWLLCHAFISRNAYLAKKRNLRLNVSLH